MNITLAVALGIVGLAAFARAVFSAVRGPRWQALPLFYLGGITLVWIILAVKSGGYRQPTTTDVRLEQTRPTEGPIDDFVTSDTCRSCHPGEYHSWHQSYHRTMTQVASEKTVKGNFDNAIVGEFDGLKAGVSRDENGFWANYLLAPSDRFASPDLVRRRIVMTTGSHHYQVYWTNEPWTKSEEPNDRTVWLFPSVYLFEEEAWLPRHATFIRPPTNQPEYARWNQVCSRCHSTHGIAAFDPLSDTHDTRTVEFGISCEACHGPGKAHIEANRNPLRRYQLHNKDAGDSLIVNPANIDHQRSAEVCGRCHSFFMSKSSEKRLEWNDHGQSFRPGDVLEDHLHLQHPGQGPLPDFEKLESTFFENRFWSDGMVRVAGREYNGLLNTPCFQRGKMSCLSCHSLHKTPDNPASDLEWADDQLGHGMRENAACTQCHESFTKPDVLAAHTHHTPGSSGSNCYNCHMPHTSYGLLKGIRSHQIDSPSVKNSLETGRPNACNLCHLDKTLSWTSENLSAWYSQPTPRLEPDQQTTAASLLWLLKGDAGQRALIASAYGREEARKVSGTDWMPPFLSQLQVDPYHAVQVIANKALRTIEGYEQIPRYPHTPKARDTALQIFQNRQSLSPGNPALLLNPDGSPRQEEINRLLNMRDDTPVFLSE